MTEPAQNPQKPSANAKRSSARLMAVQAVYQMEVNRKEPAYVVDEYMFMRKNMEVDGEMLVEPDDSLFRNIVLGVAERKDDVLAIVEANRAQRDEGVSSPNEPLLLAVLLCGVYELLSHQHFDSPVIISSYVDVAKAFFSGNEPGLINGVLDSARKVLRD